MEVFEAILFWLFLSLLFTSWIWIGWIPPSFFNKVKSKIELFKIYLKN